MAEPDPSNVSPWYLRNINQALALDEDSGNVYVRTGFTGNIIIEGNVNIPGFVDAHVTEIGTSGPLTVPWMPVSIDGNSNVTISGGNVNAAVTGTVTSTLSGNLAGITGNVTVVDGGGSLTVDGTVNIGTMPDVNANITGGNVTVQQGTSPWVVDGNVSISGTANVSLPSTQLDAFGRLRVSNPLTLFDTQARYFDHQQFSSNTAGGGTVTYDSNSSTTVLAVTGNGSSVQRETTKTFVYQPGKSLLVLNTFCLNSPTSGLTQRIGYFGTQNGIFFEASGTTLNMVIRSNSSGSIVENRVAQSSWNGDRLDGTGPSGVTLNPAATQIFWMDVEWLGVGSVRTGFVINGQFIVCHTFNHANIGGNTTTYMTTACLPIRYEISSTGPVGSLRQICSTVISEGGYSLTGLPNVASHNLANPVRLTNGADTYTPLISIRLKSTNLDAIVLPTNFSIAAVASSNYKYRIYKKAITSGGSWVSAGTNSSVEYNLAPTSVVSGDVSESAFIISSNQSSQAPSQAEFAFEEQLQRDSFTGVAYEYLITATTTGNNQDLYASIEWQEVS